MNTVDNNINKSNTPDDNSQSINQDVQSEINTQTDISGDNVKEKIKKNKEKILNEEKKEKPEQINIEDKNFKKAELLMQQERIKNRQQRTKLQQNFLKISIALISVLYILLLCCLLMLCNIGKSVSNINKMVDTPTKDIVEDKILYTTSNEGLTLDINNASENKDIITISYTIKNTAKDSQLMFTETTLTNYSNNKLELLYNYNNANSKILRKNQGIQGFLKFKKVGEYTNSKYELKIPYCTNKGFNSLSIDLTV